MRPAPPREPPPATSRRRPLQALPATKAQAVANVPELARACDTTLGLALRAAATAKYVGFECADGYDEGMDKPTAPHPQTVMAFRLSDEILPRKYGYPFKIRVPTKLGFKNPKFVTTIDVTDQCPRGFCTDRGDNWFSGI